jgi:hypothetical protein
MSFKILVLPELDANFLKTRHCLDCKWNTQHSPDPNGHCVKNNDNAYCDSGRYSSYMSMYANVRPLRRNDVSTQASIPIQW